MTVASRPVRPDDISVVIPTYNRARMLAAAIESVQRQTVAVGEIVVVDDGSTDETRSVVAALTAADARIRLLVQANAGANVARNHGAREARGSWLALLDSDDRWRPDKIRRQIEALDRRPDAIASFTGITAVDGDRPLYDYDTPADLSLDDIRMHNALGSTSTALVDRAVFEGVGGFDPALPSCQDWDLWFRLRQAGPFAIVPDRLLLYEDGPHDRITGSIAKALAGHAQVFARVLADVRDPAARRRVAASHATIKARLHRRAGQPRHALAALARAMLLQPSRAHARLLLKQLAGR